MTATDPFRSVRIVRIKLPTTFHKWLFAGALLATVARMACANPYAGINDDPSARLIFAMDPFKDPIAHTYSPGDAKEKVLLRFGEPTETSVSTYETRWVGETQTSYKLSYADVEFVIINFDDRPATWIQNIEITGNAHDLKFGISIGTPRTEIISLFSPTEHQVTNNPMRVSIPTLETRGRVAESKSEDEDYTPTFEITFEFDEGDCLSRLSIYTMADD